MNKAFILAGGRGTRLLPYTIVIPKPMLPIDNIPVIEIIARQLKYHGFDEVHVSLGYLSEMVRIYLESHMGDNGMPKFVFHLEEIPLGTSGPISSAGAIDSEFLVINGDILTTLNMREMFEYHKANNAVLTIAVRQTEYQLPLGSITVDSNNRILSFEEKPKSTHLDNIGAYIYSSKALEYIPRGIKFDVNELVDLLIKANEKVIAFREDGPYFWIDIGTHADYEKASIEFNRLRPFFPFLEGYAK